VEEAAAVMQRKDDEGNASVFVRCDAAPGGTAHRDSVSRARQCVVRPVRDDSASKE
jgi:hypothetical protein